ncbi:glycosyltransferase family 4 protein [Tropicibacter sp. R15_0]|uniref:glycosyltransferase family 4 protein n=1 Tax=Tropicibacter sp. R15_0 TaxID=2821101 RepID=UPI001ADA11DB|nr:glycosyltransferase family 4 protein [Tropicibacter sp. R15_0]MBO9468064.1 glycosyltransferase family 4 protein [Tropicibacter sp. R15_0]
MHNAPDTRPHILLVGGDGHPSGVPRHICDLARALQGQARITVASEADAGGYHELAQYGARHVALHGLASRLNPAAVRAGKRALLSLLQQESPDIVWLHARLPVLLGRQLLASGDWCPRPGTRIALTYHGLPFGPGHRRSTALVSKRIERSLLSQCPPLDLVFLSAEQQQIMTRALGGSLQPHRAHVLGNASCLGPLPAPDRRDIPGRHLVMTGRCGFQKNYEAALRLMRHLPDDITLSLCGFGTDRPAFREQVSKLAGTAAPRIRCLGPLPDIRPLMAAADGYMLLSRYEGMPIGALEACEAGLPLILADFNGSADLLEGLPIGLRLTQKKPEAQARRIDGVLTRYLSDRDGLSSSIRAHWAKRWSSDAFDAQARTLVAGWLEGP